jgi:hypothetical protein
MLQWIKIALEPDIVRRSIRYAIVVGIILIAINYGDAILSGKIGFVHVLKIGLTVLVPYAVSTAASVGAIQNIRKKK